jgi:hypothetical protein
MTPKEKARELIDKYLDIENYNNLNLDLFCDECGMNIQSAKYCALIAVDQIIKLLVDLSNNNFTYLTEVMYYQKVKQELEKLKNK